MTNREKGIELEELIVSYLKPIDKYVRRTKASGASTEIADILSTQFIIEAKNWDKENVIVDNKIWKKLLGEIPIGSLRTPMLVQKNNLGEVFVSLNIKDFFDIVYKAYKEG